MKPSPGTEEAPSSSSSLDSCASLSLSLSLVHWELDFLAWVDRHGDYFYAPGPIAEAIRRYKCFWIPLVQSFSGKDYKQDLKLAPPRGKTTITAAAAAAALGLQLH